MSVSVSSIRSRLATRIETLSGWKQSPFRFEAFGLDPSSIAHLAFAVGMGKTEAMPSRQRRDVGVDCKTPFTIRFTARVRPKDAPASVDEALDAAQTLVNEVMVVDPTWPADFQILFVSSEHTALDDFIRHDVIFTAYHLLALQ